MPSSSLHRHLYACIYNGTACTSTYNKKITIIKEILKQKRGQNSRADSIQGYPEKTQGKLKQSMNQEALQNQTQMELIDL